MKKVLILSLFILPFISNWVFSSEEQMKVYLEENQFYTPKSGTYYEVHLQFVGKTLQYIQKDSNTFAEVAITHSFIIGDSVVLSDKYLLKSPNILDGIYTDFHDIQRYILKPGTYTYQLKIEDVNSENTPLSISKTIKINDFSNQLAFSPVMPAVTIRKQEKASNIFTRIGYDVVPKLGTFYPTEAQNLLYYVEVYNTKSNLKGDSIYVVQQEIRKADSNFNLDDYTRYYRYTSSSIQPIAKSIDISLLPSGNYTLVLNLINREKQTITSASFQFNRVNNGIHDKVNYNSTILDPAFITSIPKDSTRYYVASLIPISRHAEVRNIINILKKKDSAVNIKYLQAFWKDAAPENPYKAWLEYKQQVQLVERLYSNNYQVGFETDRGRVYLAYGPPSSILQRPSSPSEYPYEIWRYDKIKQYSKRRFIFYSPTGLNNGYKLLHSDMIGELHNYRWQYVLNKRNTPGGSGFSPTGGTPNYFGQSAWRDYNTF